MQGSSTPIGLGAVGDIEFWAPNRGLLITAGNGSTIPPGLWTYDGAGWHELATVCGATDGRIAWAGPDEFWTISDGRPGQAANPPTGEPPPLEDDTLCHFAGGQVVDSYASPAFQPSSYQPMHAAGCIGPSDCWFAGDPLPEPQVGAFQLHWNGSSLSAEPDPQGHAVQDMRLFGGQLYESVRLSRRRPAHRTRVPRTPIRPASHQSRRRAADVRAAVPRRSRIRARRVSRSARLPAPRRRRTSAVGSGRPRTSGTRRPAEVTVLRYAGGAWSQVLGPVRTTRRAGLRSRATS